MCHLLKKKQIVMKKIRIILVATLLLALVSLGIFYYSVAIGFGKASTQTTKTILEIEADLRRKNIKIKDSIEIKLDSIVNGNNANDSN